jgi:hypothetical protein
MLKNHGILPKFAVGLSRDALMDGQDTQLETGNSGGESLGMRTSVTGFFAF